MALAGSQAVRNVGEGVGLHSPANGPGLSQRGSLHDVFA
jgi:hypothetical protein